MDHTKFSNHHNFVKLCSLDCLDYVVTDRPVEDRHILYALKENHVNIIYRKFFADCKIKLNTLEKQKVHSDLFDRMLITTKTFYWRSKWTLYILP